MNATVEHVVSPEEVMAWVDRELAAMEAQAVAAHVEACAECSALAEEFRGTSRMMAAWGVGEVPDAMEAVVMAEARKVAEAARVRRPRGLFGWRVGGWRVWAVGGGGAVAALGLLVLFAVGTIYVEDRPGRSTAMMSLAEPPAIKVPPVPATKLHYDISSAPAPKPLAMNKLASKVDGESRVRVARDVSEKEFSNGVPAKIAATPMIARTVSLAISVRDLDAARAVLEKVLVRHGGYASDVNATGTEGVGRTYNGTLKVPAGELPQAVSELKALGKVQTETQSGEEVSAQHQDLEMRLKNARETEDRLRGILQQRTGSLSDVLEVEEEISRVRGEIEEMEGQQRGLEHRVAYSTVTVELSEGTAPAQSLTVARRLREAFAEGFRSAGEMVVGLAIFLGENGLSFLIWFALLGVPVGLVWRRYRRMQSKIGG